MKHHIIASFLYSFVKHMLTASRGWVVCCETRREMTDSLSQSDVPSKGGVVSAGQMTPVAQCSPLLCFSGPVEGCVMYTYDVCAFE